MTWLEMTSQGVTLRTPALPAGGGVVLWLAGFGCVLVLLLWLLRVRPWAGRRGLLTRALKRLGPNAVPLWLVVPLAAIWLALFVVLTAGIFWVLFALPRDASQTATGAEQADLRWYLLTLTAVTAALSTVVALPFTLLRTRFNRRQTETAEQNHITDQINKAVENLGATRVLHDAGGGPRGGAAAGGRPPGSAVAGRGPGGRCLSILPISATPLFEVRR